MASARDRRAGGGIYLRSPSGPGFLRPQHAAPPLTWTEHKGELLAALGIDAVVAYPTDESFLKLGPREFFDEIVRRRIDARAMVEGRISSSATIGRETFNILRQLCREADVSLDVVEPVQVYGQVVSSSRVRTLASSGGMDAARRMLTPALSNSRAGGPWRGGDANWDTQPRTLRRSARYCREREFMPAPLRSMAGSPAAISIGPNPTFGEGALKIEVHLIDYEGWLYGRELDVDFISRLRDIERFPRWIS